MKDINASPQAQIEKRRRRGIWSDDIELLTDEKSIKSKGSKDSEGNNSPYEERISKYVRFCELI